MIDFLKIATRYPKRDVVEIYPKFIVKNSSDLMIRGDFYAIWLEDRGLWSTDEQDVVNLIDRELDIFYEENKHKFDGTVKVLHMWDSDTGMIDKWHKYCKDQMWDNYIPLDDKLIFTNTEPCKTDYASKRLNYPLEPGSIQAYDTLMSTLYSEEERHKLEWAIGSIISGDSKNIQKFMVLYGAPGTGKSTVLNIIQQLFDGYYAVFDAKALGSPSHQFALEAFKTNPLVAIQHDGDLSKIEDNARLNSLVSHEYLMVNEKFKGQYPMRFNSFLFLGTNKPVKITDAKSGLLRRLIDVSPSGNKLDPREYKRITKQISFELGHIAAYCLEVYKADPGYYDDYVPLSMMGASNDFYNFVIDSYHVFKREDGTTLKAAWEMYKSYCDDKKVPYPLSYRPFKEELKNYFVNFDDRMNFDDGSRVRSYYSGFRTDQFEQQTPQPKKEEVKTSPSWLTFDDTNSTFDKERAQCFAQYANENGTPSRKWEKVTTRLSELDTSRLHFVQDLPDNHIVIDFDLKDENGRKSRKLNMEAASKWPPTYAELSKSGEGIHLHYIYTGDPSRLSRIYDDQIEVKVFNGKSSLRRKLTGCNNLPFATISSGLPLKGEDKVVNSDAVKSEKGLRVLIKRGLSKEVHSATKPSVDFINFILNKAYDEGLSYDVSDMRNDILAFAASSTNQADYCIKLVNKMPFKSEEPSEPFENDDAPIVFYDVEVFPNLFLVNWKYAGEGKPVVRMINPTPTEIEEILQFRLIGFNCRRYDNHILYARLMGYDNEMLFNLSQKIVNAKKNASSDCLFGEAYNISYTDVYDFSSNKQSLKKWEIDLGIHHQELGLPWDKPVPEELWTKVAEYCDNDVIATEAVFNHLSADWMARQILAEVAGMSVNTSTNSLTARIIFGKNRKPQDQFNYRNMGEIPEDACRFQFTDDDVFFNNFGDEYTVFDEEGRPIFPGYKYDHGKSTYRGEEVGEGGYVYAEPGIHRNVALLDIASMHPASIIAEQLFGPEYTKRFQEIRDGRVLVKHLAAALKELKKTTDPDKIRDIERTIAELREEATKMLNGALVKYLDDEDALANLAQALKIAINAVYGQTAAKYENAFKDPRNKDNIVAKRGALFMINLKHEVQKRGFTVAHIKTDSIKVPEATPEIIQFIMDYGKQYGYTFEHEATYEKMCLVNDAVYIAKCDGEWTATGAQFQIPYVFKTLFSREPIELADMCETFSVQTSLHLDMNEDLPDVSEYERLSAARIALSRQNDGDFNNKPKDLTLQKRYEHVSDEELDYLIKQGHDYHFIGKVGQFCPVIEGSGGGVLLREGKDKDGNTKYDSASGAKGYRWLESEAVKLLGKEKDIDRSFYNKLVDNAVDAISQYGDFEEFVA